MSDVNPSSALPLPYSSPACTSFIPSSTSTCPLASPWDNGVMLYMSHINKGALQMFKWLLMREKLRPGSVQITWKQLCVAAWAEVVHLLIEHFSGQEAWDVTYDIFSSMNQKEMCSLVQREISELLPTLEPKDLNPRQTQVNLDDEESDKIQKYRLDVRGKYYPEWNKTAWPGNHADFLYQDVHRQGELLPCLFLPQKPQARQPKTVVIQGIRDIGKTTLAKKVMVMWAQNMFYAHKGWYAFYFHCQELHQAGEWSFSELIERKGLGSQALVSKILSHPDQLLLLFDGLEETPLDPSKAQVRSRDWNEKLPAHVLLSSLLSKTMLPEATLLLFVGLNSWQNVKPLLKGPTLVTLTGFTRAEKIRYFRTYFGNTQECEQALTFAMQNAILFSMCQVPLVCWLVCCCLKEQIRQKAELARKCPNATSVIALYLSTLFPCSPQTFSGQTPRELEGLCHLASSGMWGLKCVFSKGDLEHSRVDEASAAALVSANILRRVEGDSQRYAFALFIFQEFFAALFYVLHLQNRSKNYHALRLTEVQCLLTKSGRMETFLAGMGVFLSGLLNAACAWTMEEAFRCKVSLENKEKVLKGILLLSKYHPRPLCCGVPQVLYCLAEIRENKFISEALRGYHKAPLKIGSNEDIQAAGICLSHCQDLKEVQLSFSENFSKEWRPSPGQLVHPTETNERTVFLFWWANFCTVFRTNKGLEVLTMMNSVMEAPFSTVLARVLKHSRCKLQRICLSRVGHSLLHKELFSTLTENQQLRHLEIQHTEIEEEAMQTLRAALKSPRCPVQCLRLEYCVVNPSDWTGLAYDLQRNVNLQTILLRNNSIELFGAYYLSVGQLTRLALENCNLTELSSQSIAFFLTHNRTLTHLSLAENTLGDNGVNHIWRGLSSFTCPLTRLVLRKCAFTSACSHHMTSVLRTNTSLRSLDLSWNDLRDVGTIQLCEALEESDSNLEILELEGCLFTSKSCHALASLIQNNGRLWYLDLTSNEIGAMGVQILLKTFPHRQQTGSVILERKAAGSVDMLARLMGPVVEEADPRISLKIIQDWRSWPQGRP